MCFYSRQYRQTILFGVTSCKGLPAATEKLLLTLPKRVEGPELHVCFCLPSSSKITSLVEISACKLNEKLFRLLESSSFHVNSR